MLTFVVDWHHTTTQIIECLINIELTFKYINETKSQQNTNIGEPWTYSSWITVCVDATLLVNTLH